MLCKLCQDIFATPPEFIPTVQLPSGLSKDPLNGIRYSHQPSLMDLKTSAKFCHLCAIFVTTLNDQRKGGSIEYVFDENEDTLLLVLFTDKVREYKYLRIRPSTTFTAPTPLTEMFYERLGNSTGAAASIKLARIWIDDCNAESHPSCFISGARPDWFPTRVIDVGNPTTTPPSPPRLVLKDSSLLGKPYVTLSHCWGGDNPAILTDELLLNFQKEIPQLPKSFRDACEITRQLGLRYLWIDSLCIIQQQPSLEDWLREGPLMGAIYKNSSLTISASAAANSYGGCFQTRNPLSFLPCKVSGRLYSKTDPVTSIWIYNNAVQFLDTSLDGQRAKINTRGWVMQERILSRRILHFGRNQIFWECNSKQACEAFPEGLQLWTEQDWFDEEFKMVLKEPTLDNRPWEISIPDSMDTRSLRYADWGSIVNYYSQLDLTFGADKLIAMSALAQEWAALLQDDYLAGLWKNDLLRQLLWWMDVTEPSQRKRCLPYRAPTWSWASIEGKVSGIENGVVNYHMDPKACKPATLVRSTIITPIAGSDTTGRIREASIVLRGRVKVAGLSKEPKSQLYKFTDSRGSPIPSRIHPDFDLGSRHEVHCILILTVEAWADGGAAVPAAFGLLIDPIPGASGKYERLGCFQLTENYCSWVDGSEEQEITLL